MATSSLRKPRAQVSGAFSPTSVIAIAVLVGVILLQAWGNLRTNDAFVSVTDHSVALSSVAQAVGNPLAVPEGYVENLPSVRVESTESEKQIRKHYGGAGDKLHLGGFTDELDMMGVSPAVWKWMVEYVGVKSVIDLGCGKGTSSTWFHYHNIETLCVEGSHDAVLKNMLPDKEHQLVEHDFARGPWWPQKTYDAVWCVEFLEHVGRNFHHNYLPVLRKAAYIFVTHSTWGGWHHVEVHNESWWITRMQSYGFVHSPELTKMARSTAATERREESIAPNGKKYNAQHIWMHMLVFINPAVSARPEYARMLTQPGCSDGSKKNRPCGKNKVESIPPPEYNPIKLTPEMDAEWETRVFGKTAEEASTA